MAIITIIISKNNYLIYCPMNYAFLEASNKQKQYNLRETKDIFSCIMLLKSENDQEMSQYQTAN